MKRRTQWQLVRGALFFVLLSLSLGAELGAETSVLPLVDRPGACRYCEVVAEVFAAARTSIDLLLSNAQLEENPLWETLLAAAARGVRIRVLLDASDWSPSITEKNRPAITFLNEHGIDARFDDPAVTTHAKLAIVDREIVVLGSTNWNHYAFTEQEQANVRVEDRTVGDVFSEYFDRLWAGTLSPGGIVFTYDPLDTPEPLLIPIPDTVDTAHYADLLLELLHRAERSIHVAMYRISYYPAYRGSLSNEILAALIDAAGRGLDVKVLMDDCAFYPDSAEANLEAALYLYLHGIDVRRDDPSDTMHAKLVIIDGETVLLGSTNWNYYALEQNNEADLALVRLPEIACVYEQYFRMLWEAGRELTR
jgi:phosphatidylserine/phosphatidylglycerophosphate/cardiolipin synthase-like enzyme